MDNQLTWGQLKAFAEQIGATDDTVIMFERLRDEPDPHDTENHWYAENANGAYAEVGQGPSVFAIILINR